MARPTAATISRPTRPDRAAGAGAAEPIARLAAALLGIAGLWWGWYGWQARAVPARFGEVAAKILAGETFDPAVLSATVREAERHLRPDCNLRSRREILIVRARIVDTAIERGDIDRLDDDSARLDQAAQDLLACSPWESFGWLMRYGVSLRREGLSPASLGFLRNSYLHGPREAWIAVRRNRLALANFFGLPPDLQQKAGLEFRELIASQLHVLAAASFAAVSRDLQVALLRAIDGLDERDRYRFVMALRIRRFDVDSLGIDVRPDRPWWKF